MRKAGSILLFFIFTLLNVWCIEVLDFKIVKDDIKAFLVKPVFEDTTDFYFYSNYGSTLRQIHKEDFAIKDIRKIRDSYISLGSKVLYYDADTRGRSISFIYDLIQNKQCDPGIYTAEAIGYNFSLDLDKIVAYYQNNQFLTVESVAMGAMTSGFGTPSLYDLGTKKRITISGRDNADRAITVGDYHFTPDKMHLLYGNDIEVSLVNIKARKETVIYSYNEFHAYRDYASLLSNELVYIPVTDYTEDHTTIYIYSLDGRELAKYLFTVNEDTSPELVFFNNLNNAIAVYGRNDDSIAAIIDTTPFRKSLEQKGLYFVPANAVVTVNKAKLYENANTAAPVTGNVVKGEKLAAIDKSGATDIVNGKEAYWFKVRTKDNAAGWIFGGYVDIKKAADNPKHTAGAELAAGVVSLSATSFIDYKSMYTPYRVFDGDPGTAWLEAVKGQGLDESITFTLDKEIVIDEIRLMPGYFDAQWWKKNNRIKTLLAVVADQEFTFQFIDKMVEQVQKLSVPLKFTRIGFVVKGVYSSTGDDDTALAEIAFYNQGKRVELDFSMAQ